MLAPYVCDMIASLLVACLLVGTGVESMLLNVLTYVAQYTISAFLALVRPTKRWRRV